ncbi:MAG: peptidylprolyl isomerase [Phycisphaerae bacterium]
MVRLITALTVVLAGVNVLAGDVQGDKEAKGGDPIHPRVKMETTLGDIILELDAEKAPVTVLNFIQYAEDKFYDGTIFHRVIKEFMIQGGGFTVDMEKKTGLRPGIKNEWQNGLKNAPGTIAMARLGGQPDSATSQFFINVVNNARLDQPQRDGAAYCVFGKVVEGMDTVEKIRNTSVSTHPKYGGGRNAEVPTEPVIVKSVRPVGAFDRAKVEAKVKAAEEAAKAAEEQAKAEREKAVQEIIKKTEKETGKKFVTTDSGLMYLVLTEGEGESPKPTDQVEVHYTGWLLDGTQFDSSYDRGEPATFPLGGVIKGWTEGVGMMKVGGKRKLLIPPELAYGERGRPSIPPNSPLLFDVELLSINP